MFGSVYLPLKVPDLKWREVLTARSPRHKGTTDTQRADTSLQRQNME